MSKTLREVFGHWKAHDVEERNRRTPCGANLNRNLGAGSQEKGQDSTCTPLSCVRASVPRREGGNSPARPLESDLHDQVESYCRSKGWYYLHSRMDRRTTVAVGAPDFVIFMPQAKTLCLELKRKGGKATKKQLETIAHLRKLGHVAAIADNWEDALLLLK